MVFSVARRRRITLMAAVSGIALAGIGVFATSASAHEVTGVDVTCTTATVHFAEFPNVAVPVHIVVQVGAEPAIVDDVNVDATAPVDIDVTWTNFGAQHVHSSTTVTCGTATTTSTTIESTTTMATTTTTAATTTTTTMPRTTTTTIPPTTTTTTVPQVKGKQIFQVEFRACHLLHIGYEHLPAGIAIHYSVKQGHTHFVGGNIVTQAGNGLHFATASLGKNFTQNKATVHFYWKLGGKVLTYAVSRSTDCR
jgi:hypothetical protein